jgi:hypothetical protein
VLLAMAAVVASAIAVPMTVLAADGPFTIDGTIPDTGATELPDIFGSTKS